MNIISFDLGSNMALAHNVCGDVLVTDHKEFTGPRAHRNGAILVWLEQRIAQITKHASEGGRLIVYERPFARGYDATRCGWAIAGLIEAVGSKYGWAVTDQTPQAIKKFAIGGRARVKMTSAERTAAAKAEKILMIEAAQRMGYPGEHEHEADAVCLLRLAEAEAVILPRKGKK